MCTNGVTRPNYFVYACSQPRLAIETRAIFMDLPTSYFTLLLKELYTLDEPCPKTSAYILNLYGFEFNPSFLLNESTFKQLLEFKFLNEMIGLGMIMWSYLWHNRCNIQEIHEERTIEPLRMAYSNSRWCKHNYFDAQTEIVRMSPQTTCLHVRVLLSLELSKFFSNELLHDENRGDLNSSMLYFHGNHVYGESLITSK